MFQALLQVLGAGLSIWEHKEKTKYLDRYMRLKREYHDEFNKPEDRRSDAELDRLEFELRLLASGFATSVGEPNATAKP